MFLHFAVGGNVAACWCWLVVVYIANKMSCVLKCVIADVCVQLYLTILWHDMVWHDVRVRMRMTDGASVNECSTWWKDALSHYCTARRWRNESEYVLFSLMQTIKVSYYIHSHRYVDRGVNRAKGVIFVPHKCTFALVEVCRLMVLKGDEIERRIMCGKTHTHAHTERESKSYCHQNGT